MREEYHGPEENVQLTSSFQRKGSPEDFLKDTETIPVFQSSSSSHNGCSREERWAVPAFLEIGWRCLGEKKCHFLGKQPSRAPLGYAFSKTPLSQGIQSEPAPCQPNEHLGSGLTSHALGFWSSNSQTHRTPKQWLGVYHVNSCKIPKDKPARRTNLSSIYESVRRAQ